MVEQPTQRGQNKASPASAMPGDDRSEPPGPPAVTQNEPPWRQGGRDDVPLLPGMEMGRYVLLGKIGSGGMGTVFAAYDTQVDRKVALKVLRADKNPRPIHRARLLREAQALARLSHPNVITVYEVGTYGNRVFLAMDLIVGKTLRRAIRTERLSWEQILELYIQAGRGLAAAHDAGIVHRDFKPDNVLVGDSGRVIVLDFGLAQEAQMPSESDAIPTMRDLTSGAAPLVEEGCLTQTGRTMGTPSYMPVEQHMGWRVDARSDQFSFCVSLFESLYGRRPFLGEKPSDLIRRKAKGKIVPRPPEDPVPDWLYHTIIRGLTPTAKARFPSMEALLWELGRERPRTSRTLRRSLVATGVGLAVGVVAYFAIAGTQRGDCDASNRALSQTWDPVRAAAIGNAFEHSGVELAPETWPKVRERVSTYSQRWTEVYNEACQRAEHSPNRAELNRTLSCLQSRQQDLDARLDLFAAPDDQIVETAISSIGILHSLDACLHRTGSSNDAGTSAESYTVELQDRLAEAKARRAAGRFASALDIVKSVLTKARHLANPWIEAEALYGYGRLEADLGHFQRAEARLEEAVWTATGSHHDGAVALAMTDLVRVVGLDRDHPRRALNWARHARPAIRRAGDPPSVRARLSDHLGTLHRRLGHAQEAVAHHQDALRVLTTARPGDPRIGSAHAALGADFIVQGDLERAQNSYQHAFDADLEAFGPAHPRLAQHLDNLGLLAMVTGNKAEALAYHDRSYDLCRPRVELDHQALSLTAMYVAGARLELGDRPGAEAAVQNIIDIAESAGYPDRWDIAGDPLDPTPPQRRRTRRARMFVEHALAQAQARDGAAHPRVIYAQTSLGALAFIEGDMGAAMRYRERAVATLGERFGTEHPQTQWANSELAWLRQTPSP